MKKLLCILLLLVSICSCSQQIKNNPFKFSIDKTIKDKVESKLKTDGYNDSFKDLLLMYEAPIILDLYVNDTLTISEKGKVNKLFKSFYYKQNDSVVSIDGAFGMFGGFGFSIKLVDEKPTVYALMAADEIPIYSLTKKGVAKLRIEVPCKNVKLVLSEQPKLQSKEVVSGYVEFESDDFYERILNSNKRVKKRVKMKTYFKSLFYDLGN